MRSAAARKPAAARPTGDLYARIGAFLRDHGLSPDPAHYGFAHAVLTDPQGPLGQAVARITDDGVRLSRADIEALGGTARAGAPTGTPSAAERRPDPADALVRETQAQVEGFARVMRDMQDETRGFGRDLAEHAAEMRMQAGPGVAELARLTGAMVARVHTAEQRLADATREADELRAKLEEAHMSARRDPLTGLPNRRAFGEAFAARAAAGRPFHLALCDVDRFKRINDGHGHGVGDRVLHAIGQALAQACAGQIVARYGGEEFAVLIEGVGPDAAAALLEEARASVASRRFRARDTDALIGQVTLSVGLTGVALGDTLDEAVARADRQLYAAKAAGRDRLRIG